MIKGGGRLLAELAAVYERHACEICTE